MQHATGEMAPRRLTQNDTILTLQSMVRPTSTLLLLMANSLILWSCAQAEKSEGPALPAPIDADSGALDGVVSPPTDGLDGPSTNPCDPEQMRVVSVRPWVGGGAQIALELLDDGVPVESPQEVAVAQVLDAETLVPVQVATERVTNGLTTLLVVPSEDVGAHGAALDAAHELVDALPDAERIAIVVADEARTLMADLTARREHLHWRIDQITARAPVGVDETAAQTQALIEEVGGLYGPVSREMLIVDGAHAGETLANDLARRRAATVLVGLCPTTPAWTEITLSTSRTACAVPAPEPAEHVALMACDPVAAAADAYPWPDTVRLALTQAELETHDAFHAALDKSDIPAHVALGDSALMKAAVHFRGQSSLDCARKSYAVNLEGPHPRRLAPGAANDEFYLLSLCLDDGYFRQIFANAFYRERGLFPLRHRLVELTLNDESRGVYMLLEKPNESLPGAHLALEAVIRRRFDPEDKPEDVKLPVDPVAAQEALSLYKSITGLVESEPAASLGAALDAQIDLDRHLLYLAFQAVMENGDYVDEAYFYGLREGEDPQAPLYFRPMGWDSDDLFSPCHHQGVHATPDPAGVAFCVEGDLELAIYAADDIYERFALHVETLLTQTLTPDIVATRVGAVRDELFDVLDHEAACTAMVEVGLPDCDALHAHIEARMSDFLSKVAARHDALLDALAVWKAGQ